MESESGFPGDAVGAAAEGKIGWAEQAEDGQRGGGQVGEPVGDTGATRPMAIFVPRAVFDEEQAVLDLPVGAHGG